MSSDLGAAIGLCRLLGLFPPETESRYVRAAYRAYRAALFVVVCLVTLSMTVQLFTAPNMNLLARTIDMWTMCWTALYKWFYVAAFGTEFLAFHRLLDATRTQATAVLQQMHAAHDHGPAAARRAADEHARLVPLVSNAYALSGFVLTVFLCLGTMVTYPKGNRSELEYFNDLRSYPLCCWMPFTVDNYWTFVALCILMFLVLFSVISIYLIIDTYLFGAIYIIGGQFDLLAKTLSSINLTINNESSIHWSNELLPFDQESQAKCYSLLSKCIKHHGLILQCVRSLKNMFSTLILFDYIHAITSLTFAMFQTTTSIGLGETIGVFTFILISLNHQFLNNFFGEYIIQKQINQQKAAYDFPWRCVDSKSRQLLTMIMCTSNKPLVITGMYMYKLCYKSFIAFIKSLYTYYMVLRKIHLETTNDLLLNDEVVSK